MARSKSSGAWLKRHVDDHYVKAAQKAGYRSRAAFKLLEIQEKDRILKPNQLIVDLGAAPGGWTQIASQLIGSKGRIVALDRLPMDSFPNVDVITGDFTEQETLDAVITQLGSEHVDVVLSDMAPNLSGNRSIDQPQAMLLVELAIEFAKDMLKPGGVLLVKVFQGTGFDEMLKTMRSLFDKVVVRKPGASRSSSREQYWLGTGFKGQR